MTRWTTYNELTGIDKDGEAIGGVPVDGGWNVVRPTLDGNFAVIMVRGKNARIVKVLPDPYRARAYNMAMSR